jgi:hypothetical protein
MYYSAMNELIIVSSLTQPCSTLSPGIGTLRVLKGVATSNVPPCAYKGAHANAEYQAISGYTAVPLEQNRGPGGNCSHWSEACMKDELMTPNLTGNTPLSRITVGSLEDAGYTVDYTKADPFGRGDLGNATDCICNRQSLLDVHRNETHPLGLGHPNTVRRVQSNAALQFANDFGQKILQDKALPPNAPRDDSQTKFVGDLAVSVVVWTGEEVTSVVVRGQN